MAAGCHTLIIGAFSNISAISAYCTTLGKDVMILCSGWNNRFNMEDSLFGGALTCLLKEKGFALSSDGANMAYDIWMQAKPDTRKYISRTEHIQRLIANNLADSVEYCLTFDTTAIVPVYDKEKKAIFVSK
jgi:2-phosphosulfolactate phosphatase